MHKWNVLNVSSAENFIPELRRLDIEVLGVHFFPGATSPPGNDRGAFHLACAQTFSALIRAINAIRLHYRRRMLRAPDAFVFFRIFAGLFVLCFFFDVFVAMLFWCLG